MSNPVIFKTSAFGGFQKAAVLSYIDQMNANSQKLKTELDGKIAMLEAQVAQLKGQIPTEEEQAAAQKLEKEKQQKSQEMTALVDQLNLEIARQQKLLAAKDEELKLHGDRIQKLQFQAESHSFKAQKYDEIAMKVGSLVIDAKQQADRIVAQAKEEASAVTREKEERLEKMNTDFLQFKQNVEQLREELRDTLELLDQKLGKLGITPERESAGQTAEEKHTFAPFHFDQNFR
ncbi:MAG: hypothetical protein PHE47_01390 [Oscillospiraceae bacterium]|nr:hypothetical protein [Oscillospiraceae bacterium]